MEEIKLFDSELKLMELVWENPGVTAKQLAQLAQESIGWNKNTTYTILKKLVGKETIKREEPGFRCIPLVTKEQIQISETNNLIDKFFSGSRKAFFSAFISKEKLSKDEIEELKHIIESSDDENA